MANGVRGRKTKAISGEHNVTCDRTGMVFKRSEMRYEWNGLLVHKSVWEPKHPQLNLRPRKEEIAVRDARSEGPAYFPTPPTPSEL
jgi:hypothetical protein